MGLPYHASCELSTTKSKDGLPPFAPLQAVFQRQSALPPAPRPGRVSKGILHFLPRLAPGRLSVEISVSSPWPRVGFQGRFALPVAPAPGGFPKEGPRPSLWSVRRENFQGEDPIERVLSLNALFAAFPAMEKRLAAAAAKPSPRPPARNSPPAPAGAKLPLRRGGTKPAAPPAKSPLLLPALSATINWNLESPKS